MSSSAQAANYTAERLRTDGVEVVRLTDAQHRTEVSICPSVGNIAFDMKVNGKQIFAPPNGSLSEWKAKPSQAGIPFLAPWANRIDGDAYWANGKKYLINPDAANIRRDPNGLSIHGLVLFAEWELVSATASASGAEITSKLEFWRHPGWMAQFPFAHTVEMTYRLSGGVLEVRTSIQNHSQDPMPLVIGFHPWYQIPDASRDSWKIHLPVKEHYTLAPKLVPTGETTPANLPDPTPLAGRHLDDVFGGVNHSDEFWVEAGKERIAVRFGPKFTVAVIYAPESRAVVCFEPITGVTNGFNLAHAGLYKDLQSVAPGSSWSESFWVHPSGF